MPKGIDITEENLEDLLAYDDLFLDYFNAFLSLPVFAQALYYNRLTGTFLEVQGSRSQLGSAVVRPPTPPYGATDEEREKMLEWAREERLPLFLKTELFREFKLCKLLLRPLEDRCSASRDSSRMLRGYSRQTESYISSLSNSVDNSANDDMSEYVPQSGAWQTFQYPQLYRYKRPGSKALSLPSRLGLLPVGTKSATTPSNKETHSSEQSLRQTVSAGSKKLQTSIDSTSLTDKPEVEKENNWMPANESTQDSSHQSKPDGVVKEVTFTEDNPLNPNDNSRPSSTRSSRRSARRSRSASMKQNRSQNEASEGVISDYDAVFGEEEPEPHGQTLVDFGDEQASVAQTESQVRRLEGRHKMTFQEMKEHVLASTAGMNSFTEFLRDTSGTALLNFWLDCENFKDTMENYEEERNNTTRNIIFRNIKDKYKLKLTPDARVQMSKAGSNMGLSHTVFIRTQYDILRRIRTYWVPRYLLHKERTNELRLELVKRFEKANDPEKPQDSLDREPSSHCFFPSISLVNSMSVRAEDVLAIAKTTNWEFVSRGGRSMEERIKSARVHVEPKSNDRAIRDKLILALSSDKAAGGPFETYLNRNNSDVLKAKLQFWQDVIEYGEAEDRSADRLLRMVHAWGIFNKYIATDAKNHIGVTTEEKDTIHQQLLQTTDFVKVSVFDSAKQVAVDDLEKTWIRYLKEDAKAYLECHIQDMDESPPSTAEEFEIIFDEEKMIIRRPRPWVARYPPSTASERGFRLRTALSVAESIDEVRRAEQRKRAKERRKQMEKERRKAIRAARRRQKEAKMNKNVHFQNKPKVEEDIIEDELPQIEEEEKPPEFNTMLSNKGVMALFKKYVTENEGKDIMNILNLFLDIDAYQHISLVDKNGKQKRDVQANFILKSYMEQGARKKVHLNEKVYNRLENERDRPKSPTLKETQACLLPTLQEHFDNFWKTQNDSVGGGRNLTNLSQAELALRGDNDTSFLQGWNRKGRRGKTQKASSSPLPEPSETLPEDIAASYDNTQQGVPTEPEKQPAVVQFALTDFDPTKWRRKKSKNKQRKKMSQSGDKTNSDQQGDTEDDESSQQSRRKKKIDGRAQPTREDKNSLYIALTQAAAGHLPVKMLYFYKYLVKHGDEDGFPLIDKDLFFYCEVQKFKDCHHAFADEELLKRKVEAIHECFIETSYSPSLQVDISTEAQQKSIKQIQRYMNGKDVGPNIFDDAQVSVFKELLPFWAGFVRSYKDGKKDTRPLTKREKERLKRLEEMRGYRPPSVKRISLPRLPKGGVASFTYTISDGIKWREDNDDEYDEMENVTEPVSRLTGSRASLAATLRREKTGFSNISGGSIHTPKKGAIRV